MLASRRWRRRPPTTSPRRRGRSRPGLRRRHRRHGLSGVPRRSRTGPARRPVPRRGRRGRQHGVVVERGGPRRRAARRRRARAAPAAAACRPGPAFAAAAALALAASPETSAAASAACAALATALPAVLRELRSQQRVGRAPLAILLLVHWWHSCGGRFCSSTGPCNTIDGWLVGHRAVLSSQHWRCRLAQPGAVHFLLRPFSAGRSVRRRSASHRSHGSSTRRTAQNRAKPTSARPMLKSLPLLAASVLVPRTRACVLCRAQKVTAPPRPGCGPPPRRRGRGRRRRRRRRAPPYAVADAPGGDAPLIAAALAFFVAVLVDAGKDPVDAEREPELAVRGRDPSSPTSSCAATSGRSRRTCRRIADSCRRAPSTRHWPSRSSASRGASSCSSGASCGATRRAARATTRRPGRPWDLRPETRCPRQAGACLLSRTREGVGD